MDIVELYSRSN